MGDKLPRYVEENVLNQVLNDLDPKPLMVHTKLAVATILGGLLSLIVCGQFGIGLTDFAEVFTHKVHATMGPFKCAIICGLLFSIFPTAILRFVLCHPIQFKVMTRKRKPALFIWFLGFGGTMAFFGHHGNDLLTFVAWMASAIFSVHVSALLYAKILPQWNPQKFNPLGSQFWLG